MTTVPITFVLIGRNEGSRLARAIDSLPAGATAVYVDSGSSDGSASLARSRGLTVIELDPARPFSAARRRNEGAAAVPASTEYIHFMDGDCELQPGWLEAAIAALNDRPDVAVVCGRRRERFPTASIYNRLIDLEWDTAIGESESCGGDALFRRGDFVAAGGFDELCLAGEEPELCARLRAKGRKILRVDAEMTLHDAALTSFGPWWRRQERSGYGGTDSNHRQAARGGTAFFSRQLRSAWTWGLAWPAACIAIPVALLAASWHWAFLSLAAILMIGAAQALRITRAYRSRGLEPLAAVKAGGLTMLSKFPQVLGQIRWHADRLTGRKRGLIEYKGPSPLAA